MKTRRVCVMLETDVPPGQRAAASDAYALIATRTRALRGDLSDVATAPATPVPGNP